MENLTNNFHGYFNNLSVDVPILNGQTTEYVNFDNAASTPPMAVTQETLDRFLPFYSLSQSSAVMLL